MDIAEHATRIMAVRDGRIQSDRRVEERRFAADEIQLAATAVA